MKRLFLILSAIAFLWGCEKIGSDGPVKDDTTIEDETPDTEAPDTLLTDYVLPEIIYASMTDEDEDKPQTRTVVGKDGKKILWQNGDAVSFFFGNVHNARYTYTGEDGVTSAELTKDDTKPGTNGDVLLKSQAVYPYNENVTVEYDKDAGLDKIILTYPTTQKYAANSFGKDDNIMVAAGKNNQDDKLYFRNACGYLVIKLYGAAPIKSITLSSVSGTDKIAGSAVVVASHDAAPVITMADDASTAVTLDCCNGDAGVDLGADAQNATEFWFCLPPVTFTNGIKITVNDMYGNTYTKQTSKTVTIERNKIQPMAALEFVSNAPAATKLWYTRSDDKTGDENIVKFYDDEPNPFDAQITEHKWDGNKFVIEFASPLTTIKEYAFRETQIETITLPEGLVTIEKEAFRETPLTEITIPGSVNNVGIDVFWECSKLSKVTFLPSVTKTPLNIGYLYGTYRYGPFYDAPLTSIDINRELILVKDDGSNFTQSEWWHGMFANEYWDDVESVSIKIGPQVETLSNYMFNKLPIQTLTIPGTVKTIGNCVFDECTSLTSLKYEPSPTGEALTHGYNDDSDDDGPFYASPLTSVNLNREINYTYSSSAGNASEGLFGNRTTLASVTLGEQVKTLSPYMFANAAIKELVIPGTVTTILNDVFYGCKQLATLTFEPSPSGTALTMGYDTDGEDENLFQNYCPLTTLNLNREINYTFGDSSIDSDSEGLFGRMPTLTSVTLGEQIKTLHKYMFAGSGITEFVIPGTVTTIQNDVFHGCKQLATLTFNPSPSETPLNMGYDTVGGNENLFQDDCPLTTLNLDRDINYTFEESDITSDSKGLFGGIPTLTSVTLGDQVKTLYKYMFAGSGITSLNLNKVETIKDYAFKGLGFTNLTIPGTLSTIGNNVFEGCTQLTNLTFNPSSTNEALTLGFNAGSTDTSVDAEGPFYDTALTKLTLNRQINYPFNNWQIISSSDGAFSVSQIGSLKEITLGDQVTTLTGCMFARAGIKSINLNKVTKIEEGAFCNTSIESITIPSTVESVGPDVFDDCEKLSIVNIQDGTEPLKFASQFYQDYYGPFHDSPLTDIYLGREINYTNYYGSSYSPSSWDAGFFATKKAVDKVNVTISDNVQTISNYMFAKLNLLSITIPASVTSIGLNAFIDCDKLDNIVFEDGDTPLKVKYQYASSAYWGPFYDSPLTSITLGREIEYIKEDGTKYTPGETNDGFFASEDSVEKLSVTFTDKVKSISEYMFAGRPIQQLTIPASVTSIGNYAFFNCDALVSLNISFPSLAEGIFNDCDNLTSVTVSGNLDAINKNMFSGCPKMTTLNISGSVETIGDGAFDGFNLTSLNISGHVGTIGANAFDDNDNMTSFTVTSTGSVDTIGASAFEDCDALTLDIQGTVNKVGAYAFSDCDAITTLSIRANVVEDYAYEDMDGLLSATLYGATVGNGVFYDCNALQTVVIDGGVNSIGDKAFYNCGKLSSVTFNESANKLTIGYQPDSDDVGPFYQSPLATIRLYRELEPSATYKEQLDNWDMGIFTNSHYNVSGLTTSVTLGSNVKTIWPYMFSHVRIQQLTIPASVTTIGNNAFDECRNLSRVTFESGSQELHIGFQDHSSDKGTFFDSPLTYINLDRELVYDYDDLDYWDEGIFATDYTDDKDDDPVVTVTLGTNVKTILPWMFSGVRMEKVEIPTSVTEIRKQAFYNCYRLTEVSCRNNTPPTLGEDVFYNDKDKYNNNLTIKVPYLRGDAYREKWSQYAAKVWGTFVN